MLRICVEKMLFFVAKSSTTGEKSSFFVEFGTFCYSTSCVVIAITLVMAHYPSKNFSKSCILLSASSLPSS
jgi:hypothetical protein